MERFRPKSKEKSRIEGGVSGMGEHPVPSALNGVSARHLDQQLLTLMKSQMPLPVLDMKSSNRSFLKKFMLFLSVVFTITIIGILVPPPVPNIIAMCTVLGGLVYTFWLLERFIKEESISGNRLVFFGTLREEKCIGIYISSFSFTILNKTFYGFIILNKKTYYKIVLTWGFPLDSLTEVLDVNGLTQRVVLRGKQVSLENAIETMWEIRKHPELNDDVDTEKLNTIIMKLSELGLTRAAYINPLNEPLIAAMGSDKAFEKISELKVESLRYAESISSTLDEQRKTLNRELYGVLKKINTLYRNILKLGLSPNAWLASLIGSKASALEQLGLLLEMSSSPETVKEVAYKIKQYAGEFQDIFTPEPTQGGNEMMGVMSDMQRKIDDLEDRIRRGTAEGIHHE